MISRTLISATALLFLAACQSIDLETGFALDADLHSEIIDQSEDLYPEIDPLALSDEIMAMVDEHVMPLYGDQARVAKLQELLYEEEYLNLQYTDAQTHTAIEAFEQQEGNCLSAMNLYVAMARYAGIEASFQTVEVQPSWDRRGGLLVLSKHINATGRLSFQKRYVVDFTPEIALQQLTASEVSDQYARGLYFNNLGVEEMIEYNYDQALTYFKNALFLVPDLSIAWNNIGATYNRIGRKDLAEYSYKMAFNSDDTNATAVNNLAKYYRSNGEMQLAGEYEVAIERFNNRNPYFHYARGQAALLENDLETARISFRRALRLKQAEPDFYLALAEVYTTQGYDSRADALKFAAQELLTANAGIYRPSDQKLRIIDQSELLRDHAPGITIRLN